MNNWVGWSLLALVTWGFWGLFPKLATKYTDPNSAIFYEALGAAFCGILLSLYFGGKPEVNFKGCLFGGLTGAAAMLGGWFYLYAARSTNISSVVVLTALYPVVTIILAALTLKEPISVRQIIALILAFAAITLLATEQKNPLDSRTQASSNR
jgi:transporter family protein